MDKHQRHFSSHHKSVSNRRGAVLVVVMICLLLVSLMGASLVKLALAQRRQSTKLQLRIQAAWLAESALDRAAARLRLEDDYQGEAWKPEFENQSVRANGIVEIRVSPIENDKPGRAVTVVAEYPVGAVDRARARRTLVIH